MTGAAEPVAAEVRALLPTRAMLADTAAYIEACQEASGAIPWEATRHTDPWDHVECAMALTTMGRYAAADAAFGWLLATQRVDGTWPMQQTRGRVEVPGWDTNQCAYVATGVWHHWLVRRDRGFVEVLWPAVRLALDAVCRQQLEWGGFAWVVDEEGAPWPTALVAGSSSVWHSLRCGLALADLVGEPRRRWAQAAGLVAAELRGNEAAFDRHPRFSMDWYYPVLGGVLRGAAGRARIAQRWDDFVVPGLGTRCVDDRPWVTGAETCELALALEALGDKAAAARLIADVQHLRDPDGSYHTGFELIDRVRWPVERSTWTAAAMILACDAVLDLTPGASLFRAIG